MYRADNSAECARVGAVDSTRIIYVFNACVRNTLYEKSGDSACGCFAARGIRPDISVIIAVSQMIISLKNAGNPACCSGG